MSYANLHKHTMYSLNDGADTPLHAAQYAKQLGQKALAITDHGSVFGLVDHYRACKAVGIHPVLGIEAYHQPVFAKAPLKADQKHMSAEERAAAVYAAEKYHLSLLVKNMTGYKNLMQMMTRASKESFYGHPIFTDALLAEYHEGLICLSGCLGGYIGQHVLMDDRRSMYATDKVHFFRTVFGEDFYLEVMPYSTPEQVRLNQMAEVWSDLYGIPIVLTEDSHYVEPGDYDSFVLFNKIKHQNIEDSPVDYRELHMHGEQELLRMWEESMHNNAQLYLNQAGEIARQCEVEFDSTVHMPKIPGVVDEYDALKKKAIAGAKAMGKAICTEDKKLVWVDGYGERLKHELRTLDAKGFNGYMLLESGMAQYAQEHDMLMSGRGSVCGSLLAYFLGLHFTDPIKYGLSFEMFCGPDRVDWPDIDNDVEDRRRDELVEYIRQTYGNAEQIVTFGTLKKQSLVNRFVGTSKEPGVILFENGDAQRFRDAINKAFGEEDVCPDLAVLLQSRELAYIEKKYGAVTHFHRLYGWIYYVGKHAAGVAIPAGNLTDKLAVVRSHDEYVTCYPMEDLERIGVLKVDVLGLNTLSMIADAQRYAGRSYRPVAGCPLTTYTDSDLENEAVMALFSQGDTLGLMQSETKTPTVMYKTMEPKTILDLADVNAANRPQCLAQHTFAKIMEYRTGKAALRPAVYQEDLVQRCLDAGLSWEHIAKVLKAVKHGTMDDPVLEATYIAGCKAQGMAEKVAKQQWDDMKRYLFKKAHAVSYSLLAAIQAYLKKTNPLAFYLALLQNEHGKDKQGNPKRLKYEADASHHGIYFLLPHINGEPNYSIVETPKRKYIQQGMVTLDGVGIDKALAIAAERVINGEYTSLENAQERLPGRILNKTAIEALQECGGLEFDVSEYLRKSKQLRERIYMRSVAPL